ADARTYACAYCGTRVQVAIDGGQIAAGMRLDLANADAFLGQLASTLSTGFAEKTRIESQQGRVVSIEVSVEPNVFFAAREASGVVARHKRVVRGIALKTTTVPLDRWVEMLTEALAE